MGSGLADRQPRRAFRPLVAFDFDGTLTCRDSFRDFLAWRVGAARYSAGMIALAPALARYLRHRDRGMLKAAMVARFLGGVDRDVLAAAAARYAADRSPSLLRPDAVACWKRWQAMDARLVIVTASPEILVEPFAHGLGAWLLIGTRLTFTAEGRVAGALEGRNCRGEEKARRLREALGDDVRLEAAYGDSAGDTEMLALSEDPGYRLFELKP